jgi:hypothetical protein
MISVKIEGAAKLKKWTLKLPENYTPDLKVMFSVFDDLYKSRLDSSTDIHGSAFEPNRLFLRKDKSLGLITLPMLKAGQGPLVRTGTLRDSLESSVDEKSVSIKFATVPYQGAGRGQSSPAKVAAQHQSGFVVKKGDLTVISGYPMQPDAHSHGNLVSGAYYLRRGFTVPKREHFGIPADDISIFTDLVHNSVRKSLLKHHSGVN